MAPEVEASFCPASARALVSPGGHSRAPCLKGGSGQGSYFRVFGSSLPASASLEASSDPRLQTQQPFVHLVPRVGVDLPALLAFPLLFGFRRACASAQAGVQRGRRLVTAGAVHLLGDQL